ncbi:hypothetical protein ACVWYH_007737 [Bradyrhizobium sp. GM24.11]|jgi:hypothetical protein
MPEPKKIRNKRAINSLIGYRKSEKLVLSDNHDGSDAKAKLSWAKTWEAEKWKPYAACAQWRRCADRVPLIILTEVGSYSPKQSTGSTWQLLRYQNT